jgi:hypothetical protein
VTEEGELRKHLHRFVGECYLHERMTSAFFDDPNNELPDSEVFHLV